MSRIMTISETLRASKALINMPQKWVQGHFRLADSFCAVGAMREVTGQAQDNEVFMALAESLPKNFIRVNFTGGKVNALEAGAYITFYNDNYTTSHADMMALFNRAIEAAEAHEHWQELAAAPAPAPAPQVVEETREEVTA